MPAPEHPLLNYPSVEELAEAVTRRTTMPALSVMYGNLDGSVTGILVEPYAVTRLRESIGRFVVHAGIAGDSERDAVLYINELELGDEASHLEITPRAGAPAL